MIVAGHQPQYLPYIGFFNKIAKADIFVLVDNIQFTRKTWQQRTLIKSDNKPVYLTIPVKKHGKFGQWINEVEIIDDGWRKKHWKSISLSYNKTPYFHLYKVDLEAFYKKEWLLLNDFCSALLRYLINAIGLKFKKIYTSTELNITGEKTDLLIDICRKAGCDTYLSGSGARAYVQEEKFKAAGLNHVINDYTPIPYTQYGSQFLEGMAIIDVMFMYGPKTMDVIKGDLKAL
jgi:hypothetical protein